MSRAVLRIVAHLNVGAAIDAPHLAWARLDTSHLRLSIASDVDRRLRAVEVATDAPT